MFGGRLLELGLPSKQQPRVKQQPTLNHPPSLKDVGILEATKNIKDKPKSLLDDLMIDEERFLNTELPIDEKVIQSIMERHRSLMEESQEGLWDFDHEDQATGSSSHVGHEDQDQAKWSVANIVEKKFIPLFEIDNIDPVLEPFVKKPSRQLWRLTPLFKKTCKAVIRGLLGLVEIKKPIGSLTADCVVFGDEDTMLQDPKFVDLYDFREVTGTCHVHSVFCNFLLDVINLSFGLDCKRCFSSDTLAKLEPLLTLELLDFFILPRFSGEKILEHPALMSVGEKIGKFTDIRTYVKDNQDYLDDAQSSGVGFEWMSEAENHLLLGAMFIKPCDTYINEVPSFVDFVRNTVEDLNTNIQHALVNKEDIIQKFSRFSQKQINSVTNLHMNQVHELIERVFPQAYTYVFRTEIPDYWMEWKPTLE